MIEVRKANLAFGLGSFTDLGGSNPSVLSFLREYDGPECSDIVLCVNNLSRFAQPVELDLSEWEGWTPVELFGETPFPKIGTLPYMLSFGPHGFMWFRLVAPEGEAGR
jgi:maltose alpha-D-glucosyltransferase/alpha-amylase